MTKPYLKEVEEAQKGMTKEDVLELLKNKKNDTGKPFNEYVADLDNLPSQTHRWVDRGLIMSCEGGDHPHHQAYKR